VKIAKFHPAARDALRAFPEDVRRAFGKSIHDLQLGHSLAMPLSKAMPALGSAAAELRIRDAAGIYRAFYVVNVLTPCSYFTLLRRKLKRRPTAKLSLARNGSRRCCDEEESQSCGGAYRR
jgi:phage-related protein